MRTNGGWGVYFRIKFFLFKHKLLKLVKIAAFLFQNFVGYGFPVINNTHLHFKSPLGIEKHLICNVLNITNLIQYF